MRRSFYSALLLLSVLCFCPSLLHAAEQGSVYGWGSQKLLNGQTLTDITQIAAGGYHSLALKSDGSIIGWGADHSGQATPPSGNDFIAISVITHPGLIEFTRPNSE